MITWCRECKDDGVSDAEAVRADADCALPCPSCPRCVCGERMHDHCIYPGEHYELDGGIWAPDCWREHVMSRYEEDRSGLLRGVSMATLLSAAAACAAVLIWRAI